MRSYWQDSQVEKFMDTLLESKWDMGLLAEESPSTAFRIMKKYLSKVEVC